MRQKVDGGWLPSLSFWRFCSKKLFSSTFWTVFGGAREFIIQCGDRFWDSVVSKRENKREVWIIPKNHKKHTPREIHKIHACGKEIYLSEEEKNFTKMKISKIITKILASTVASAVAVGLCPDACDCTNENKVVICAFKGRDFRTENRYRYWLVRKISSTDRTKNSDPGPVEL